MPILPATALEQAIVGMDEPESFQSDGLVDLVCDGRPTRGIRDGIAICERVARVEAQTDGLGIQSAMRDHGGQLRQRCPEGPTGTRCVLKEQTRGFARGRGQRTCSEDGIGTAFGGCRGVAQRIVSQVRHHAISAQERTPDQLVGEREHRPLPQVVIACGQVDEICRVGEQREPSTSRPLEQKPLCIVTTKRSRLPLAGTLGEDLHAFAPDSLGVVERVDVALRDRHVGADAHPLTLRFQQESGNTDPLYAGRRYTGGGATRELPCLSLCDVRCVVDRPGHDVTDADTARPWQGRAILHVDLDAFFAAVEQLDHPEWRGRPVIVGGDPNRRGVVATASYEARAYGVHSAMPSARAALLCPDAIWTRGSFDRYREVSGEVMSILRDVTPSVEPVSIDEAYLDVTPGRYSDEHPVQVAEDIRSRIAALGITASVGLATSKTVAKVASDHMKPDALTIVWPGEEASFLAPLPVSRMSGIGPRTSLRLMQHGVRTLGDLAALDPESATAVLGPDGPKLTRRAAGEDARPVRGRPAAKSVSNERTFSSDLRTPNEVHRELDRLATRVTERLVAKGLSGRTVTVKVRFSDFTTRTLRRTLPTPADDPRVIGTCARELLSSAWTPGVGLRLLGVGVSGFTDRAIQLDLLSPPSEHGPGHGRDRLAAGVEAVRRRFGPDALRFGSELGGLDDEKEDA